MLTYYQQLGVDEDSDAIQIHLKGLRDLIQLRGGFDGLPVFLIQIALLYVLIVALGISLGPVLTTGVLVETSGSLQQDAHCLPSQSSP